MVRVVLDVAVDLGLGQLARREPVLDLGLVQVEEPQQRDIVQVGRRRHRVALQDH